MNTLTATFTLALAIAGPAFARSGGHLESPIPIGHLTVSRVNAKESAAPNAGNGAVFSGNALFDPSFHVVFVKKGLLNGDDPVGGGNRGASTPSVSQFSVARSLRETTAKLVADNTIGSTEILRTGRAIDLTATVGMEKDPMQQQSVNVHVRFDARPVGGILKVKVELVPVFGGIGAAVRPTISQEFAQAVDDFDDDFIAATITKLTDDIAEHLTAQ